MKPPYRIKAPRKLLTFTLPDNESHRFAGVDHLWRDMWTNGTLPRQGKGVNLEVWDDDGSPEFHSAYLEATSKALARGTAILEHLLPEEEVINRE